ncbi:MAG: hypothetical protein ABW095_12230 [Candidatus Thiodiazotropha sp.]
MNRRVWVLILVCGGAPMAMASLPEPGENLEYTLKFRGWITGYVELDIAKLNLQVEPQMDQVIGRPAYVARMLLTTEPYAKAEMLYPVRLSYRSWLDAGGLYPVIAVNPCAWMRIGKNCSGLTGRGITPITTRTRRANIQNRLPLP